LDWSRDGKAGEIGSIAPFGVHGPYDHLADAPVPTETNPFHGIADMKPSNALASFRQRCCLGLPRETWIAELLTAVQAIIPSSASSST
jgi:hypothetical protein